MIPFLLKEISIQTNYALPVKKTNAVGLGKLDFQQRLEDLQNKPEFNHGLMNKIDEHNHRSQKLNME
jgi:hypothetical protein